MDRNISDFSEEELIAENQRVGAEIEKLKQYKKDLTVEHDKKVEARRLREAFGTHLSDEDVAAISSIVSVKTIKSEVGVKDGKRPVQ